MRDLVVILIVVLLVFGTKKLRSLGSDLGAAVKGFRKEAGRTAPPAQIASPAPGSAQPDAEFPEVAQSRPQGESQGR